MLVEDDAGWQEVGRYVHLNPVRIRALSRDQRRRAVGRNLGLSQAPSSAVVAEQLVTLRQLAERVGGLDYAAVGAAVSRFHRRLAQDRQQAAGMVKLTETVSNIEMTPLVVPMVVDLSQGHG